MSNAMLSAYGLNDLFVIVVIGFILLFIFVAAFFFADSGSLGNILNGVDKALHEKLVYENIPKLREIARLCPDEKISTMAQKLVEEWDKEIQPSLKHMSHDERKKALRRLYKSSMIPVLEKYKQTYES